MLRFFKFRIEAFLLAIGHGVLHPPTLLPNVTRVFKGVRLKIPPNTRRHATLGKHYLLACTPLVVKRPLTVSTVSCC